MWNILQGHGLPRLCLLGRNKAKSVLGRGRGEHPIKWRHTAWDGLYRGAGFHFSLIMTQYVHSIASVYAWHICSLQDMSFCHAVGHLEHFRYILPGTTPTYWTFNLKKCFIIHLKVIWSLLFENNDTFCFSISCRGMSGLRVIPVNCGSLRQHREVGGVSCEHSILKK